MNVSLLIQVSYMFYLYYWTFLIENRQKRLKDSTKMEFPTVRGWGKIFFSTVKNMVLL